MHRFAAILALAMTTASAASAVENAPAPLPPNVASPMAFTVNELGVTGCTAFVFTRVGATTQVAFTCAPTSNVSDSQVTVARLKTPVKATITLSIVRDGHFTKMVEVREGERLVAHYGTDTWPPGASQH